MHDEKVLEKAPCDRNKLPPSPNSNKAHGVSQPELATVIAFVYTCRFNLSHPQYLENSKRRPLSSSHAVCWVDTLHLRRNMLPDEVEQGGTVIECMAAEPREQMPSFGDRAAGLRLTEAAGWRSHFVRLGFEHRS